MHVPSLDVAKLSQYFRSTVIRFFLQQRLINERLAKSMQNWTHSGFSVDLSVKIPATSSSARLSLAQYIARPPLSLKKMLVEEHASSVLYRSEYNPYFKTNQKLFPAIGFLVDLLQHLPDAGAHLIPWASALRSSARARRYGLYSSRSRGTWSRKPYLLRLAPDGLDALELEGAAQAALRSPARRDPRGQARSVRLRRGVQRRLGSPACRGVRG